MIAALLLAVVPLFGDGVVGNDVVRHASATGDALPAHATPTLESLFAAAQSDPRALPALLTRASAELATLPADRARSLADTLELFSARAFFSSVRFDGMESLGLRLHKVKKGETPTSISKRLGVSPQMLAFLNDGFEPRKLRVGQTLKVLDLSRADLLLSVDRAHYRLSAWANLPAGRVLVMHVPVGLGAVSSPTPAGRTRIVKRVLDPQWTHPETQQVFAPNDPGNLLGGYWIALDAEPIARNGIGLHGFTGAPSADWIAQPASHGCVRMLQHDIDRVFHLALEGTPVELR